MTPTATISYVDPEAQLKADYADLQISCGYIGNVYQGPVCDYRSFRVFIDHPDVRRAGIESIHVFDVPHGHKGVWMEKVQFDTPEVRARLDDIRAKFLGA